MDKVMIPQLEHLHRIDLGNCLDELPNKDCWVDCPMWDIPETMLASIRNTPPQIKAMTFVRANMEVEVLIREACKKKDIIIIWAERGTYRRTLDREGG